MADRGRGAILNVASVAGLVPTGTYGAAKAWLIQVSESLRHDLAPHGLRVLAVCPGFTHTGAPHIDTIPESVCLTVDQVIDGAMKDTRRNKPLSIASWRLVVVRWLPRAEKGRVDLRQTNQPHVVECELPGLHHEEIDVEISERELYVT